MTQPRIEKIGNATLYLGDCRDILPTLPKVDAVITDPPYGLKLDVGMRKRVSRNKACKTDFGWEPIHGDDKPFDPAHLLEFDKVIMWGGNHYASRLPDAKKWLVWEKRGSTPPDHNSDCELAWTNLPGVLRMFRHTWRGMIRDGRSNIANESLVHPTQKPVELMAWCIREAKLNSDATVLDPYMGSGTCGIATVEAGPQYVGIEIVEKYFDIACERIENAQRQATIF